MERIGDILGSLRRDTATTSQKTADTEHEMTIEESREELRKSLGVSSLDNTFDNFKPVPGTEKALIAFKELARGKGPQMLLCYGGVGNGKTHLCEATAIELFNKGERCRVMTMDEMMIWLKRGMEQGTYPSFDDLMESHCRCKRLIVDDADGTPWEFEQLEKIIRVRYHENRFTILTTNRDLPELPERLVSRFRDAEKGRLVLNQGEDYRPEKGKP